MGLARDAPRHPLPQAVKPSMPTNPIFKRVALLAAFVFVASCADAPTQPATPVAERTEPSAILGSLLAAPDTVVAVTRTTPLTRSVTVSRTIGLFGGTLAIPEAGVSIYFPPGAVLRSTTITMTAPAGSAVAYEFGPHGARFLVPPVITQRLPGLDLNGSAPSGLTAAYFTDLSQVNLASGVSLVTELLNLTVALGGQSVSFPVQHFSGYLIAMGANREMTLSEPAAGQ